MKRIQFLLVIMICLGGIAKAQTNTAPLPSGVTKIGGHLSVGASNEVWTDAASLYFNYRGNAGATHFWNLGGGNGKSVMSILQNGNVGIGISTPQKGLHVLNNAIIESTAPGAWDDGLVLYNNNNRWVGTVLHRDGYVGSATAKYWYGLRSETNNFIMMGPIVSNAGTSISAPRQDAVFEIKGEEASDRMEFYVPISFGKNVGLGTITPRSVLDVRGTTFLGTSGNFIFHASNELNYKYYSEQNEGWWINYRGTDNKDQFRDFYVGNGKGQSVLMVDGSTSNVVIGIGSPHPNSKLDVKGMIKATEIKVESTGGADFVFEEDYQLKELSEVEQFITTNKHLPDIPSAKQMEEEGVGLAEMNKLLLQKVEELTLYLIEKDKKVNQLEKEIQEIKEKLK